MESIQLSEKRRNRLELIAASVEAKNTRGIKTGQPSWRALVYAIADGKVNCSKVEDFND